MKIKELKTMNNIEKEITKLCPEAKWYGKLRGDKKGFVVYSKSEQENLFTIVEIEKNEEVVIRQYPLGYDAVPKAYLKAVKQYFDEIQKVYGSDVIFNVDDENRVFLETRFEPIKELNLWLIFSRFDIENFLFSDSVNKLINGDLHRISDTVQYIREKEREAISELAEDIKNGKLL